MLNQLLKYSVKPRLYASGTAFMWTDPHISKQLLAVHLNGDVDLASRSTPVIDGTVGWVLKNAPAGILDVLDLGCGPGLYTERFAMAGHRVTGVDMSTTSIEYARAAAKQRHLVIDYRNANYLTLTDEAAFDLVVLIYTDLGVLLPEDRQQVIDNVFRALKPGGRFIFDVLNRHCANEKRTPKNFDVQPSGFWRPHPFVALSESFFYPDAHVILYQHIVADDNGVDVYRFWTHLFSDDAIHKIVTSAGFDRCDCFTSVLPAKDAWSGENVTFCVATKPIPDNVD